MLTRFLSFTLTGTFAFFALIRFLPLTFSFARSFFFAVIVSFFTATMPRLLIYFMIVFVIMILFSALTRLLSLSFFAFPLAAFTFSGICSTSLLTFTGLIPTFFSLSVFLCLAFCFFLCFRRFFFLFFLTLFLSFFLLVR